MSSNVRIATVREPLPSPTGRGDNVSCRAQLVSRVVSRDVATQFDRIADKLTRLSATVTDMDTDLQTARAMLTAHG